MSGRQMWQSDDGAFSQDVALAESGGFGLRNNVNRSLVLINEGKYTLHLCTAWSVFLQFVRSEELGIERLTLRRLMSYIYVWSTHS